MIIILVIILVITILLLIIIVVIAVVIAGALFLPAWPPLQRAGRPAGNTAAGGRHRHQWVFIKGGCSRRGVQWMGVVS